MEYHFSKGFDILEYNTHNLEKLTNEVKQRINAEETYNSNYVTTCINTIPSTSSTLKNLLLNQSLHYSYVQIKFSENRKS